MSTDVQTKPEAGNGDQSKAPSGKALIAQVQDRRANPLLRVRSLKQLIEANQESLFQALPKQVRPERLVSVFLGCVRKNPKLLDCKIESVMDALRKAADLGLEPGDALGFAYLVPYKDECVLLPGYKGLIDLSRRSGNVSTVFTEVVRDGDYFTYTRGHDPKMEHEPSLADDRHTKRITHVYAVFKLRDGGVQWKVMTRAEIEHHKEKHSQSWRNAEKYGKKDSTWHTDWEPMARKTVVRMMINSGEVPVSPEIQSLVGLETRIESDVIDVEARPTRQANGLAGLTDVMKLESLPTEPPRLTDDANAEADRETATTSKPHLHKPAEEQEVDGEPRDEELPLNDRETILNQLRVDLDAAATIKACKVLGESYIRKYARGPEEVDAIVKLVADRQSALRGRDESGAPPTS